MTSAKEKNYGEFTELDLKVCLDALGTTPKNMDAQEMMRTIVANPNLPQIAEHHGVNIIEIKSKLRGAPVIALNLLKERLANS